MMMISRLGVLLQTNALEVLAGRTPKCSVPPPPYPKVSSFEIQARHQVTSLNSATKTNSNWFHHDIVE